MIHSPSPPIGWKAGVYGRKGLCPGCGFVVGNRMSRNPGLFG